MDIDLGGKMKRISTNIHLHCQFNIKIILFDGSI